MTQLSLSLLGSFQAALDEKTISGFKSNKVRALLAYLAVEADRPHRREKLAGLLWPDWPDKEALSNLRYTLSDLRRAIGDRKADPPFLLISRNSIQFNAASDHDLDVTTFLAGVNADSKSTSFAKEVKSAMDRYKGEFLEGFSLEDSSIFEEWTILTRERLARQASAALHTLAETCEQSGEYEPAQTYMWRQLELEPWDELAHRRLMRIMAQLGQRSAALAQYETCKASLAEELGVEPAEETTKLYEQIRMGKLKQRTQFPPLQKEFTAQLPNFLEEESSQSEAPIFVAREQELTKLNQYLDQSISGQGRVVFITGEAGSGKTSLLDEFSRCAQDLHPELVVASGKCNAYTGIGDPYLPFREILELLTGDIQARWAAGAISREHALRLWGRLPVTAQALVEIGPDLIDTFVQRAALLERAGICAPTGADWLHRLTELLDRKPVTSLSSAGSMQSDLFEQYTRVLLAVVKQGPLLLLIDDLQWADLGSISLLFHFGRRLAGNCILIVGAYRPEEVALEKDGERHALEPLVNEFRQVFGDSSLSVDQAEGREFIDAFLDTQPNQLGKPFRELLFKQTLGHPLFTTELLRGLQERGDLIQDAKKGWVEGPSLNWETLPARVEAVIRERIGRLPGSLQRILEVASVEGEDFTAEIVAGVLGESEREVVKRLSSELAHKHRLVRAQAIEHIGSNRVSRYRFRSYLSQKYIYDNLDEVERTYIHEDVGKGLEHLYGEQASEIAVQLARHFYEARIIEKAIQYLHQAGTKAVLLSAYQEGSAHLNRGLSLLELVPDSNTRTQLELDLQLALGTALVSFKGCVPEVEQTYIKARELCQDLGDTARLCRVVGEMSVYYFVRAEYFQARELAEETFSLAREVGDPLLVALGQWLLGFITFALGEYTSAQSHLEKVIDFYNPDLHHHAFIVLRGSDAGVSALAFYACSLLILGYPDQAAKRSQEALALAREFGHPFTLTDAVSYAGCFFNMMRRDSQAMKKNAQELKQLVVDKNLHGWLSNATWQYGEAIALSGRFEEGIAQIRQGLDLKEYGEKCYWSGALYSLAEAQANLGRTQESMKTLIEAFNLVEERNERYYEAELYRLKGKVLLLQGDEDGAEVSLQEAIEVARHQQARMWELRSVMDLCRLWERQGKKAEAQERLARIYRLFTEGFDTPDLVEANRMLKELSL